MQGARHREAAGSTREGRQAAPKKQAAPTAVVDHPSATQDDSRQRPKSRQHPPLRLLSISSLISSMRRLFFTTAGLQAVKTHSEHADTAGREATGASTEPQPACSWACRATCRAIQHPTGQHPRPAKAAAHPRIQLTRTGALQRLDGRLGLGVIGPHLHQVGQGAGTRRRGHTRGSSGRRRLEHRWVLATAPQLVSEALSADEQASAQQATHSAQPCHAPLPAS